LNLKRTGKNTAAPFIGKQKSAQGGASYFKKRSESLRRRKGKQGRHKMARQYYREGATRLNVRDYFLIALLRNVEHRCHNPNDKRFDSYGGRGIHCRITLQDLQILYERDRPDLMLRPSIDRRDSDGDYTIENCRFIEMRDNAQQRKYRVYTCENCGDVARPRKINGKLVCTHCAVREAAVRLPKYTTKIIRRLARLGHNPEPVFTGDTLKPQFTLLTVNNSSVRLHFARHPIKAAYWFFNSRKHDSDFHIFICRNGSSLRYFVCTNEFVQGLPSSGFYIPVLRRAQKLGGPRKINWYQFHNAWHLLVPASESKEVA